MAPLHLIISLVLIILILFVNFGLFITKNINKSRYININLGMLYVFGFTFGYFILVRIIDRIIQ